MKKIDVRLLFVMAFVIASFAIIGVLPVRAMMLTPDSGDNPTGTPTTTPKPMETREPTETPRASETPKPTTTARPSETPRPQEVHFKDTIKSKTGNTWVIGPYTVTVDANTKIETENGPADVGAFVEVEAIKQADGSLLAKEIEVVSGPDGVVDRNVEFLGAIQSISPNVWVVAGRTLNIISTTVIFCDDCGTPEVGFIAEVHATLKADGTLIANRIEVHEPPSDQARVEFRGVISAFSTTQWTVGGRVVLITAKTQISGTPQIGLVAEVQAGKGSSGTLTALKIKVERPEVQIEVEFKGPITSINGNTWVVAGKTVHIMPNTMIDDSHGAARVGAIAEVKGTLLPDGGVNAIRIIIERAR